MITKCLQLYRLAILSNYAVVYFVTRNLDVDKVNDQRAWDFKLFSNRFFTGWNIHFQIGFLVLALLNTLIQTKSFTFLPSSLKKWINTLQGYIFTCLVVPSTLFVSCMFWTLWNIDRELVLSRVLDVVVPSWLNHSVHTVIIIPVVVEMIFCKMVLPHHKHALTVLSFLHLIYTAVLISTYLEYGRWIYNVFEVLGWPQKFLLNCLCFALSLTGYFIGYKLQELRWHSNFSRDIRFHTKSLLRSMINF